MRAAIQNSFCCTQFYFLCLSISCYDFVQNQAAASERHCWRTQAININAVLATFVQPMIYETRNFKKIESKWQLKLFRLPVELQLGKTAENPQNREFNTGLKLCQCNPATEPLCVFTHRDKPLYSGSIK